MSVKFDPLLGELVLSTTSGGAGGVTSVSNADGTMVVSPTTGAVDVARAAISGDVIVGPGSTVSILSPTGVAAGSYLMTNVTVDSAGRITAASDGYVQSIVNAIIFG